MQPLAYFLTWSTYATRLHGDARGSVDRDHNRPGTPLLPPAPNRERARRASTTQPPMTLDTTMRRLVASAITDHAALRRWHVLALAVQTNHVHVVIDVSEAPSHPSPEKVMHELKSWATRRLREARCIAHDRRVWTAHASTRWINDEKGLLAAVDDVERLQSGPDARARNRS